MSAGNAKTVLFDDGLIDRFAAIVGAGNAISAPGETEPYAREPRGLYHGATPLVLRPGSTAEVAEILKLAHATRTPIIPQGGNTGLTGAQVPADDGGDAGGVILSLARMNRILDIDTTGNTMTVESGAVLQAVQEAARAAGRLFPLSLGAEGSCQIGGNLSTNAGGTAVLAYGNMRQLCLGLETVLANGDIWNGLRRLKKDNTGYDLRDLFIGAEGTLGVITKAVLKLFPIPKGHEVMFAGVQSPADALALFRRAEDICGPALTGFELMPRIGVEFTTRHIDGVSDPLADAHPWYALIDISSSQSEEVARAMAEALFETGSALIRDAVLAQSETQRRELWTMREAMSWAQQPEGGSIKHDISVPVAHIPDFITRADAAVLDAVDGARIVAFGHIGDGNIHYNVSQPVDADKAAFLARWGDISRRVHAIVLDLNGSISAEHGIGQLKRDELAEIRSPVEMDLMHRIKSVFDPNGIMNPGKVLKPER